MRTALLLLALAGACDAEGGRFPGSPDAETGDAAAPRTDGGDDRSSCQWRNLAVPVVGIESLETRPIHPERSARFRIEVEECAGDEPGPWSTGFTLENEWVVIMATVWRSGPDCAATVRASRDIVIRFPYPGIWKLQVPLGSLFPEVEVLPPPAGECGEAEPGACQRDCDCEPGALCFSGEDVQRCARPCEVDRDCLGDGRCGDDDGLDGVCRPALDECTPQRPCPDGFACEAGACQPTFVLDSQSRHSCECDADCEAPLRCVAHPNGEETWSQCEVVCHTPSDGWCQGAHSCNPAASVEAWAGVCGWVGE
jgi:hypothetical protein